MKTTLLTEGRQRDHRPFGVSLPAATFTSLLPFRLSRFAPEQLTRWAGLFVILLTIGSVVGGWQFRRAVIRDRQRALHAATVGSNVLLSVFQRRVVSRAIRDLGPTFEAAITAPIDDDLTATAVRMRRAADNSQKHCAPLPHTPSPSCDHLVARHVLLFRVADSTSVAIPAIPEGSTRSATYRARLRRFVADSEANAALHIVPLEGEDSSLVAFVQVTHDVRRERVAVAVLVPAHTLAGMLFEPARNEALAVTFPDEPARDTIAAMYVRTARGRSLFESHAAYAGVAVESNAWVREDAGLFAGLSINPAMVPYLVPGGIPSPPDRVLAAAALLFVALAGGALLALGAARRLMHTRTLFLTGVSHELRTPLTQILMYGELLQRGEIRGERLQRAQTVIVRESRRLIHMIENILAFTRSGTGRLPVNLRTLVLAEVINIALDDLGPTIHRHGATVERHCDPTCLVSADAGALRQILVNLIDNALRFGPAGQLIHVFAGARDGDALLAVSDQGPGIPPALRERAWEPFTRLNDDVGGTGIGLPLVRLLAEAMQGTAQFGAPREGFAGVCVEVRLPLAPADAPPTRASGDDGART